MPSLIFQLWGGGGYLLQKIFLSRAERSKRKKNESNERLWRIWAWSVYIIGLPGWVIIFVIEHNWIAAGLETGGLPAMIVGLIVAYKGKGSVPMWLNYLAVVASAVGIAYSAYDFGTLLTLTQGLELGIVTGFLVGTVLLAHKRRSGYLWYVLMNISCGTLMLVQAYPWLALQQGISLMFVLDSYRMSK
jgi:hypothetical protein